MNNQQRQFLIVAIVVGVLAVGGVAYYYYMFAQAQIKNLEATIEKTRKSLTEIRGKIRTYDEFLRRQAEIEATVEAIALATQRLPSSENDERYLGLITDFVGKTGVQLTQMNRLANRRYPQYLELPNSIQGTARYADFVQFLAMAEQSASLIMRVGNFTIEINPRTPTVHSFNLGLSTFVFTN
jgi:Tfp pilus assembly protein PilO